MFNFQSDKLCLVKGIAAIGFVIPAFVAALAPVAAQTRTVSHTATRFHASRGFVKPSATGTTVAISTPEQIALDGQGNLYVANSGAGNVLVYNSAHAVQTARTIAGLSNPVGVAVDPYGNTFVTNNGRNQVLEFNAAGALAATFSTGLNVPTNIAVDALDDLYVANNNYTSLSVFQKSGALVQSYRVGQAYGSMTAVGLNGSELLTSQLHIDWTNPTSASVVQHWDADSLITGNVVLHLDDQINSSGSFVIGLASDLTGGVWSADFGKQSILHQGPGVAFRTVFATLGYSPTGIAVDSNRGLIYVADGAGNQIHVYNLNAQQVAVIR